MAHLYPIFDSANVHNRKSNSVAKLILYMAANELRVLLADDDIDDCLFFKEALEELPLSTRLTIVSDGDQLMKMLLKNTSRLPHVLFLDLNMPRKNGLECLKEIRLNDKLKALPAIICSTSAEQDVIDRLYQNDAQHFIQKPFDFLQFKRIIHYSLTLIMQETSLQRTKNNFILTGEYYGHVK
jgi:CheY-like chemotaxis protein